MATTYLKFKTPHYSFQMEISKVESSVYDMYYFLVGDKENPCLDGHITLENKTNNIRYSEYENKAVLHKIEALEECSLEDITTEYQNKYSFGKEMLNTILFFINSQFPQISIIKLSDKSYIPCNRKTKDTLDLLTYSIALYGKTWYEKEQEAYILPKEKYDLYRSQVEKYMSKEKKQEFDFDLFYHTVIQKGNSNNYKIMDNNIERYKELFNSSETFPEFFIKISRTLKKKDKCKFFKDWLFNFIASQVLIEHTWYIDLFPKVELLSKVNYNKTRNKTRKNRNSINKI
jgi:hypothetical protein